MLLKRLAAETDFPNIRLSLDTGFIVQPIPFENFQQSTPRALLAFNPLSNYVGFGRSRIYQLIAEGKFPPPVKIGKSSRWVKAEVDTWLSAQVAARNSMSGE